MNRFLWAARLGLAFLWIFTAVTSIGWGRVTGYEVLAQSGITGALAGQLIYAGALLDLLIGFWLLSGFRLQWVCWVQIVVIVTYSLLVSYIAPGFWLHPFGPVTKNIPLLVLIYGMLVFVRNDEH